MSAILLDDQPNLTPFQKQVYDVVSTIPKGLVRTYGSVAQELGTSARAVGTAMGRNPYGPCDKVPWHRVVASDRSLGGFGHSWGEDQPKVQLKKRLLEEEGVLLEEGSNKIRKEYFVESAGTTKSRNSKVATREKATSTSKSKYFTNAVTEEKLKQDIMTLLQMRQAGKTCWPSEIPRRLSKQGDIPSLIDWRSLMQPTRDAARSLVHEGRVDVMQHGKVLGSDEEYRGPIRLRLCLG